MAYVPIQALIDKQDNFEVVRDQIALILATESVNQMALALAATPDPLDPLLWQLNVFIERAHPWARWQDAPPTITAEATPIINVWYDNGSFNGNAGDIFCEQKHSATFNIDCYGYGLAKDDGATGQIPGDLIAAKESQRAARLARNILMASNNVSLQLPSIEAIPQLISKRWVQSVSAFQVQQDGRAIQNVVGTRIAFVVDFPEESPQYEGQPCEEINIDIQLDENGEVITTSLIDFTAQ